MNRSSGSGDLDDNQNFDTDRMNDLRPNPYGINKIDFGAREVALDFKKAQN